MNIAEYYQDLNSQTQKILKETIADSSSFGKVYHLSSCIYEFSQNIQDGRERELLETVSSQLIASSLNLGLGLYRQAFATLRLSLEMGLSVSYFSVHKLDHLEWENGKKDIKWSELTSKENGVFSKRFCLVFFPELEEYLESFLSESLETYRALSEFVHGNYQTWKESGIIIKKNDSLIESYFQKLSKVSEVILFSLCCRYLKSFSSNQYDEVDFLIQELNYVIPIRELLNATKS